MRSEERENEEFSGKMGHAGGVCRRSLSRERPQAKSSTFDFVAGHGGPLLCVMSKDYFVADNLFCFVVSFFFFSLACASASCAWHLLSFCFFFSPRGRGVFVGGGVCNDRDLGPGLEAGPRLDKRGSPRGLLQELVSSLVVVGSFVVVGIRMEQPCSSLVLLLS